MVGDQDPMVKLQEKVSIQRISLHNGPPLAILSGILLFIISWAAGALGISASGIVLSIAAILVLAMLVVVAVILFILPSRIIEWLIRTAADILFAPYGMPDRELAFRFLRDYLLHGTLPILIIADGKVDERSKDSPMIKLGFRGPGNLVIDGASAALIERQGIHRVLTVGSHFLDQIDRIRGFVDLRLQQGEFRLENVFTKDNIPLDLTVTVQYRIMQDQDILLRRSRYTPDPQAVRLAVLAALDWKAQAEATMRGKIRDLIAEYYLNDIHGTYPDEAASRPFIQSPRPESPRVPLQRQLTDVLDSAVEQWGADVVRVTVDEIKMPEQVKETLRKAWAALWKNRIEIQEAEVAVREAEIRREATLINAQASAEAHRIRVTASAEAQLEITNRAAAIQQLTGNVISRELLGDMIRDAMMSVTEASLKAARHATSKETVAEEPSAETKNATSG